MPASSLLAPRSVNRFRSPGSFASAAALAAIAAPSLAQAQIVWSGLLNATADAGTPDALLDFNQNTISDNTEAYLNYSSFKGDLFLSVSGIASSKTDPTIAFLYQDAPLGFGAIVDNSLNYVGEHPGDLVPADGANYYYAFAYQAAGGPYYGWMEVSFSADATAGTLVQWAYNRTSGAPLTAGQTSAIPEPGTTATLLGLAAVGTAWWRRSRRLRRT